MQNAKRKTQYETGKTRPASLAPAPAPGFRAEAAEPQIKRPRTAASWVLELQRLKELLDPEVLSPEEFACLKIKLLEQA